ASRDLSRSLANRLRLMTDSVGSTMFVLTWKDRLTPSGRLIPALRASGRRTSDKGCTSWPTPCAQPAESSPEACLERKRRAVAKGSQMGISLTDLQVVAKLAAWPTPNTPSGGRSCSIEKMDATGRTADGRKHTANLEHAVKFASWPSPNTMDVIDRKGLRPSRIATNRESGYLSEIVPLASWPTPVDDDANNATRDSGSYNSLTRTVRLTSWATPGAGDSLGGGSITTVERKMAGETRPSGATIGTILRHQALLTASGETP